MAGFHKLLQPDGWDFIEVFDDEIKSIAYPKEKKALIYMDNKPAVGIMQEPVSCCAHIRLDFLYE